MCKIHLKKEQNRIMKYLRLNMFIYGSTMKNYQNKYLQEIKNDFFFIMTYSMSKRIIIIYNPLKKKCV